MDDRARADAGVGRAFGSRTGSLELVPLDPALLPPGPAPLAATVPAHQADADWADATLFFAAEDAIACRRCETCHARVITPGVAACQVTVEFDRD